MRPWFSSFFRGTTVTSATARRDRPARTNRRRSRAQGRSLPAAVVLAMLVGAIAPATVFAAAPVAVDQSDQTRENEPFFIVLECHR